MKKRLSIAVAVFLAVFCLASRSFAYDVHMHNETELNVYVNFYMFALIGGNDVFDGQRIVAGESYTAKHKIQCPSGFQGYIQSPKGGPQYQLASTSILGHEVGQHGFTAGCWDSSWKICRKHGNVGDPIKDNDYGFCKK